MTTDNQSGFVIPVITPSGPASEISMPDDLEDPQTVLNRQLAQVFGIYDEKYMYFNREKRNIQPRAGKTCN